MATTDLTSVPRVKDFLMLSKAGDDGLLQALVTRLSLWVCKRIGRDIIATDYVWRTSGRGKNVLTLPQYPVISVSSVSLGCYGSTAVTLIPSTRYWLEPPRTLWLTQETFPSGVGNTLIGYRAGYEVIPEDLDELVAEFVAFAYKERDHWGQESKTVGDQTIQYVTKSAPQRLLDGFDNWTNVVPVTG